MILQFLTAYAELVAALTKVGGPQHRQFKIAALEFRHLGFRTRAVGFLDQAVLPAGHRQINLRQQFGVEQGAVQGACRIVDLVAIA